jgi:beta-lactamase class D
MAAPICTIVADATDGRTLVEEGRCRDRVTPASTFKIALALMGFDSGFLRDAAHPSLPFKPGYPAWGGAEWRKPVVPSRWMEHSVVWYSQRITESLGAERLRRQAQAFAYGNADVSGDPGKNNGLERSWISSSLAISPAEQVAFLRGVVNRTLPVRPEAFDKVGAIIGRVEAADGWIIRGKTGSAFPRRADGAFDRDRAWGWYVGWAEKGGRTVVFAHLLQNQARGEARAGLQARDAMIRELPGLARTAEGGAPSRAAGWTEEKCRRYRAAWDTLSARTGRRGLGTAFVERHEAFLASGCSTQGDVCPRSAEELEAANMLTIRAMNAGMASTFLPFGCPKPASRS